MTFTITIRLILLFLLTQFIPSKVFAENINPLGSLKPLNNPTAQQPAQDKLPQPENLVTGWWDYFAVTDDRLTLRQKQASQTYSAQLVPLSPNESKEASYQLSRFLNSLKALQTLYAAPAHLEEIEHHPYQALYAIDEWLTMAEQLRKETLALAEKKERLMHEAVVLKNKESHLDELKLRYLSLEQADERKISLGLEIMADRATLAVDTEQLSLNRALVTDYEEQLTKLQLSVDTAREHLSSNKAYLTEVEKQQQKLQQQLLRTQKSLQQTNFETLVENNPLSLSQSRLQAQQQLNITLEIASLEVQLQVLEAKKILAMQLFVTKTDEFELVREKLPLWQIQAQENQNNAQAWSKETTRELSQAQEELITLVAENNEFSENAALIRSLKQRLKLAQAGLVSLKQMENDRYALKKLTLELSQRLAVQSGKIMSFVDWSKMQLIYVEEALFSWSAEPLFTIGETPVTTAGLFQVLLIISLTSFVSMLFRQAMQRLTKRSAKYSKRHGGTAAFYTIGRVVHYLIISLGIFIALTTIGLDFTNLALVAGALSVGIGFGLQSIVNNFVSGLILLFEGTIKIGDFVELESGLMGVVREINVRSTQIKNITDNIDVIVPNSVLVTNRVINWTLQENNRRIHVPFHVAYGTDKEKVRQAVLEAAARVSHTYKPPDMDAAHCWLVKFGESSLDFELVVWIDKEALLRPSMIHALYLWEIETSLKEHNIEIPFPQRDLHIRSILGDSHS